MIAAAGTLARPHRLALGIAAGLLALWAASFALLLHAAALPPARSGTVLVLFPPRFGAIEAFAAIAAADGTPVRATWLPNFVLADGPDPGFVGRLRAAGALAAYSPFDLGPALVDGCTGLPPER
ncbi:MAG: hypothetical protein IT561_08265 [Alphaproteobacteria bacterium]|nr:hypothetical protein [Alphaproteobacteria bacterium]